MLDTRTRMFMASTRRRAVCLTGLVTAAVVAPLPAAAAENCGDLLIVLDRSGSMAMCQINGVAKQDIAKTAIKGIIKSFQTTPMGLFVFPNTLAVFGCDATDPCAPGKVVVDVAANGGSNIVSFLSTTSDSCGGTPTGRSLQIVQGYSKWTDAKAHYVLLITDGQPTCDDGDDGAMPPKACDGQGSMECKNPTKAYDAIQALYDKGIHTFVVGFAGNGVGLGCTGAGGVGAPFNADTLNHMADLGGEPQMGAATRYYSATDAASLADSLDKILGKVAGGTVGGCTSGGPAPVDAAASDDAGLGGSGGAGGTGAQGGVGGQGGDGGAGVHPGHQGAGCGCRLGDRRTDRPLAAAASAGLLAFAWRRRRRAR